MISHDGTRQDRVLRALYGAPDRALPASELERTTGIGQGKAAQVSEALVAADLVRKHKTSTVVVYSLTAKGVEHVEASGAGSGAGPSPPATYTRPSLPPGHEPVDRVRHAERLVEIERAIAELSAERLSILDALGAEGR